MQKTFLLGSYFSNAKLILVKIFYSLRYNTLKKQRVICVVLRLLEI